MKVQWVWSSVLCINESHLLLVNEFLMFFFFFQTMQHAVYPKENVPALSLSAKTTTQVELRASTLWSFGGCDLWRCYMLYLYYITGHREVFLLFSIYFNGVDKIIETPNGATQLKNVESTPLENSCNKK